MPPAVDVRSQMVYDPLDGWKVTRTEALSISLSITDLNRGSSTTFLLLIRSQ